MNENTTKVIKLANGEDIVCTCMKSHNVDLESRVLHISQPLKMEIRNKITKTGVVEALTLSRWLQPFTNDDNFDLERSNIVAVSDASYALNNYYKFMLDSIGNQDTKNSFDNVKIKSRFSEETDEEIALANEQVKELFNKYINKISASEETEEETIIDEEDTEVTEEVLDSLPISDTKH